MYNGILNIYKEKGYTSHDVVAILRGVLGQKKIGHTGTLDPEATGVLPICLGKGTKVAGLLTDKDKIYRATFKLGAETDTQDYTGEVVSQMPYDGISDTMVYDTIGNFIGDVDQIPPMYSAIKIGGRKLYDLAREGIEVERQKRRITIHSIADIQINLPNISMTVNCSKGTYIRTLCRDISESLGTCGHMTSLERTASGLFKLEDAHTLNQIRDLVALKQLDDSVIDIDSLFDYERVVIGRDYYKLLDNGNKLPPEAAKVKKTWLDKTPLNVYNEEDDYMGIYEWSVNKKTNSTYKVLQYS